METSQPIKKQQTVAMLTAPFLF